MSWTFAEERPIYWEEPPEQIAITNAETGEWDSYMLTSKAMRMIREAKDEVNWLNAELHGAELEAARAERTCHDATHDKQVQAFTCSECGCWVAYDEYWETGIYVQGDGQAVHIRPHYCPNCGRKVVK